MRTYIGTPLRTGIEIPFPQRVVHRIADTEPDAAQIVTQQSNGSARTADGRFWRRFDMKQIEVLAGGRCGGNGICQGASGASGDPGALYVIASSGTRRMSV